MGNRRAVLVGTVLGILFLWGATTHGKVFYSIEEGMLKAFPQASRVASRTLIPTSAQLATLERRAGANFTRKLLKVRMAYAGEKLLGYAVVDIHTVRTVPEAVLVAMEPDGRVRTVIILAFHEPPEYQPSSRWLRQFPDKRLSRGLAVRRDIAGISGSTLSANAITRSVRRALAVFEILLQKRGATP